ncbi:MAG: GNAT family N-acetyltransferase [Betaproteobacteria bacterium RIFCSPLOWO2_12_FULL_65_14]|nr:MAG: GNAT family N-acetyltransferase [Betaproteobacteria bacterium RIFCSPLOWO2_12_FULL_65_14]
MEIRALRQTDDRTQFRSGDPDLDRFFQRFAAQNQYRHYIGATYVAEDAGRILAFATVAPGHMEIEALPAAARRGLARYPLPVLRLARLAVDRPAQRQGLGGQLLRFVLRLAERMADDYGCAGVVVDAKPGVEPFYANYGFVGLEAVEGQAEARPRPTPMFLGMRAIKAAAKR